MSSATIRASRASKHPSPGTIPPVVFALGEHLAASDVRLLRRWERIAEEIARG